MNVHPATVHFPIALLLISSLFTLLYLRSHKPSIETTAYHTLLVGWCSGVIAVASGSLDAFRQLTGPDAVRSADLINWVNAHAIVNIAALFVYGQALLRRRRRPDILDTTSLRRTYLALHAVGAALILIGGWLGGQLVYTFGLGT
ncbi:DUF2231 domain-containing protein [Candidatus Gracilibacteria bacterium]|nr:DUF2231 domain-containing protein [Candidatus Gracilibacteria bacterium]